MLARFATAALAFGLTAAPASAVVLGAAQLRIDGFVTLTSDPFGGSASSSLVPADGSVNPFAGAGYAVVVEMTGALSAFSTLPPRTPAIYSASGEATLGDEVLQSFGPEELGLLTLDEALAEPPFPELLGALAALPPSDFFAYSDPGGDLDGFFSYSTSVSGGQATGAFNGFLGFDDPILGIDLAATLAQGLDPVFGDLVEGLLIDLFVRTLDAPPSASESFAVRVDVTATAVPGPLAAPLLLSAVALAAGASRRRRRLARG